MGAISRTAALVLVLALAGCAGRVAVQDQLLFCDGAKPLRPAPGETAKLSDKLVGQIHGHNETGAAACGWRP